MIRRASLLVCALLMFATLGVAAENGVADKGLLRGSTKDSSSSAKESMKIRITIDGRSIQGTLADNATARDFAALLPLTVTLEDYARTEKIHYLPRKLSTVGAPAGIDPSVGDITYYAPWGNLAIFYRDFGYSNGLIKLGRIDSGIELLVSPGALRATIEVIPD